MHDTFWKQLTELFFPDFVKFYFPFAYKKINWNRKYEFLDKELQKIAPANVTGKKFVDKLVKVFLKSGKEEWILIHIEIQNTQDKNFAERMYVYNYRIFDKYKRKVASFALLCDENKSWKPTKFEYEMLGCRVLLEYPVAKLLDYRQREKELGLEKNTFADITLAYLSAIDTKDSPRLRYAKKLALLKKLNEKGYSIFEIKNVISFMDYLIKLPDNLTKKLSLEIQKTKEIEMDYITSFERVARKEGIKEGMKEGIKEGITETQTSVALKMLAKGLDMGLISEISGLSETAIKALKQKRITYPRKKQKTLAVKETAGKKKYKA